MENYKEECGGMSEGSLPLQGAGCSLEAHPMEGRANILLGNNTAAVLLALTTEQDQRSSSLLFYPKDGVDLLVNVCVDGWTLMVVGLHFQA